MSAPGKCDRCGGPGVRHQARAICDDCDPGTPLCDSCMVQHAREVLADAEEHPEPSADFQYSTLRREKLRLATDIIKAVEAGSPVPGTSEFPSGAALTIGPRE